ncbi:MULTISPECIES: hypothetical protein [unclassified Luteococcus]|uniref:hypothetical protein n=1 Tax=unclassified Luteococcus TaxID=2639923 RepID=UPI00313C2AD6
MGRGSRVHAVVPGDLAGLLPGCQGHPELEYALHDPAAGWARAAMAQWGLCGVAMHDEQDAPVAQALVCPGLNLPPEHPLVHWSKLPDAAYLLALVTHTDDDEAAHAQVRLLVQGLARHLHGQVDTLEAVGRHAAPSCLEPPVGWLTAAGFQPVDEFRADGCQRLRLDLGTTVRWRPDLARAWHLLGGLVPRPVPPAEPTGRQGRTQQ